MGVGMKFFRKSDILIILTITLIGIISLFIYKYNFEDKPARAEIYYKSQLVKSIELTKGHDLHFSIPQNKNVVFHLATDGSICFEQSDCPDKICVKTGKLHTVGQTAACLPNEIFIKIVSRDGHGSEDIDIVG